MEAVKILYVINQKSGASTDNDLENIIARLGPDKGIEHEIYLLTGDNDVTNIKARISRFKPHIVAAGGGDGTINLVASILIGIPVRLGIIPLGSANGLAYELGIPEKVEDALELIFTGNAKPMDIVTINEDKISLHLCDAGINARIVKEFEKEGKRGFTGYVKHFFKELFKHQRSFRCSIKTDNKVFTHKAFMTIIANASSYRTGANMNPGGKIDDGKFEIVVLKPYDRWAWRSLIGAFTGTLDKQPNIETYKSTSAIITLYPAQEFQVDGESLGKNSVIRASIVKHALNIILPVK